MSGGGGGGVVWSSVDVSDGSRAHTLGGLTAATPYRLRLVALDANGVEGDVALGRFKTLGPAPRDLSAAVAGESVTVRWGAPEGWAPVGYRLWWRPVGSAVFTGDVTLGAGAGSHVIQGVATGDHRIRLVALADSGHHSDPATVAVTVGGGELSASAVTVDSFTLHWTDAFSPTAGGFRVRWRVIPVPEDGEPEWSVTDVDAATRQHALGGLDAATPYRVRLSVLNSDGTEGKVALGRFETLGPPPQNLTATGVAHDAVTLNWDAPESWVPVGYRLSWRPAGEAEFLGTYGLAPGRRSQTVTNLTGDRDYVFRLTALTTTGHQSNPTTVRHATPTAPAGDLTLDISVAAYCIARDGDIDRDSDFKLADNGIDYETVITDVQVPSIPLSWRITGGTAPYTINFLDTTHTGATGTADASCTATGVDLYALDLHTTGDGIQPGPKTFTITATDTTGNTTTKTTTIEIIEHASSASQHGGTLQPGRTYYDPDLSPFLEIPEGTHIVCCGMVSDDSRTYQSFEEVTGEDRWSTIYIDSDGNEAPSYLSPRVTNNRGTIHGESLTDAQREMWDQFLENMRATPFPEGDTRNNPPVPLADTGGASAPNAGPVVPAQIPPFVSPPPPPERCAEKTGVADLVKESRDRHELIGLSDVPKKPWRGWRPYGVLSSHVTGTTDVVHGLPCDTGVLVHPNLLIGKEITVCISTEAELKAKDDLLVKALAAAIDGAATTTTPVGRDIGGWNTALEPGLGYKPFAFDTANPDCPEKVEVRSPDGKLHSVALSRRNTDFVQVEDARTCYADSSTPGTGDLIDTDTSPMLIRPGCWIGDDPGDGDVPGKSAALAHWLLSPWDETLPRVNGNRIEMLIAAGRDDVSIQETLERLARHELGHFLGLGDYARGCWRLETATLPPPGSGGTPTVDVDAAVMSYGRLEDGKTVLNKPDYDPKKPVTVSDKSDCYTTTITQRDVEDLHAIYHPEAPTNLTLTRQSTRPNIHDYYDTYWSLAWNKPAGRTPLAYNSQRLGVFRRSLSGPGTWELFGTVTPLGADGKPTEKYSVSDTVGLSYEWAIAALTRGDHRPADGVTDPLGLRHTTWPIDGKDWTAGDPSNTATAPDPEVLESVGTYSLDTTPGHLAYYGASELGQWRFAYWYETGEVEVTNGGSPRIVTINAGDLVISFGQAFTTWDDSPFGPTGHWTTPLRVQHGDTTIDVTACDIHFHHNDPIVVHYECLIRNAFTPDTDNIPSNITVT